MNNIQIYMYVCDYDYKAYFTFLVDFICTVVDLVSGGSTQTDKNMQQ